MATYPPPSFFSNIFDSNAFIHSSTGTGLTQAEADLLYYHYPVGQAFQTLQQTDHTGLATFNAGIDINTGTLKFPDNTVQTTAFTGSGGAGSLSATLLVGNSAGATDINMNNNDITNCATINTVEFDRGNNALQTTSINIGDGNLVSTANSSGFNVAIGSGCLKGSSFSGESNIAFGNSTLQSLTTGSFNLGIGSVVGTGMTTGQHNVAIGYQANQQMTSGSYCLAIGDIAGSAGGGGNTAVGSTAIGRNAKWTGSNQIVIGTSSETVYLKGNAQNEGTTTMLNNLSMGSTTAIGNRQISSSYYNFYATDNVGSLTYSGRLYGNLNSIVYDCPDVNSSGSSAHVFYNYNNATVLNSLTISNTGITNNTPQPASNDTSTIVPTTAWVQGAIIAGGGAGSLSATLLVGNSAGATDINMNNNDITNCATVNALQMSSRLTNINIGSGNQNLTSTGNGYNIAIGNTIMPLITTAKNNNMLGSSSGSGLIDGQGNNGVGSNALNAVSSGNFNVAIGNNCGKFLTTGSYNVFLGSQAGQNNVSGTYNVCVGNGAGQTDTGSSNTCLGNVSSIGGGVSNSTAVGVGATTSTANTIQLGRTSENVNCPNTLSVAGTITNTATQPASNDTSTKVPTTAWVQGAITAGLPVAGINQMWSWNCFNITGTLSGGSIRTASLVLPYSSAITFSTSCRIEFNYAIFSNSATTQTVIPNLLSAYTGQSGGTNVNPNTISMVDLVFNPTTATMNSFVCQSTFANVFTNTTTKYWRGNSAYNFVPIKFAQTAPITLNSPSAGFMTINLDVGFPAINYSSNPNYLGNLCSIATSIRITASQATTTDTIGQTTYSSGVAYFL